MVRPVSEQTDAVPVGGYYIHNIAYKPNKTTILLYIKGLWPYFLFPQALLYVSLRQIGATITSSFLVFVEFNFIILL